MITWLVDAGSYINARDNRGETALIKAVRYKYYNIDIIFELLSAGADVNARDNDGKTALDFLKEKYDLIDRETYQKLYDALNESSN